MLKASARIDMVLYKITHFGALSDMLPESFYSEPKALITFALWTTLLIILIFFFALICHDTLIKLLRGLWVMLF